MSSFNEAAKAEIEQLFSRVKQGRFVSTQQAITPYEAPNGPGNINPQGFLADGSISNIDIFTGLIRPPVVVTSLPALPDASYPVGSFAFLTTDAKLYRNTDGTHWSATVASGDITGHVGIPIAASDPTLPDSTYPTGSFYFNSSDKHLRKTINGTTWILAVDAGDIVANSITAGQIAAGTITSTEIAALTIQAGDIAANTITAGQIAAGTITATELAALSVTAAKLNIQDAAGATVLTGAGFAGSWLDFVASGVYNGHFGSGTTNNITAATIVGTASTEADYIASQSADIPLWVVSAESGAGTLKRVADSTAVGEFALQWDGNEDATIFQDLPVIPGQAYSVIISWRHTGTVAVDTFDLTATTQFRKADHSAIGSEVSQVFSFSTTLAAYSNKLVRTTLNTPVNAKYVRVSLQSARTLGSPTIWINSVILEPHNIYYGLKIGDGTLTSAIQITQSGISAMLTGQISGESVQRFQLWSDGTMLWTSGSAAPDAYFYRSAAKTLTLDSDGAGTALTKFSVPGALEVHGGTSFPASPATNDLFYRTDLRGWYFWDGAQWLSQVQYTSTGGMQRSLNPLSGSTDMDWLFPHPTQSIWLETFWGWFYVGTTNDGSKYWTASLAGNTAISTVSNTPDVWTQETVTLNVVAAPQIYYASLVKVSTPGTVLFSLGFTYRLIAT